MHTPSTRPAAVRTWAILGLAALLQACSSSPAERPPAPIPNAIEDGSHGDEDPHDEGRTWPRGGSGSFAPLSDPAWVIVLDHHESQFPTQWPYVFQSAAPGPCDAVETYDESDLGLAPRTRYAGTLVGEAKLRSVQDGSERQGQIYKLVRRDG